MAIKYLNYAALDPAKRKRAAQRLLGQYRDQLRNPNLTQQGRDNIQAEIDKVNAWMNGTLTGVPTPDVPSAR